MSPNPRPRIAAVLGCAAGLLLAACGETAPAPPHGVKSATTTALPALGVQGNQLVDSSGAPVRLLGVNRAGTEYACVQGWGIFDGPSDAGSVAAMASWRINAVRVPLNEDCWLGINGVDPRWSGAAYQQAVQQYVATLHAANLAVILDLHWAAPGTDQAVRQLPMADADHATTFWSSVATTFLSDQRVVFDLYNEPFIDTSNAATTDPWACWRDGCTVNAGNGIAHSWQAAGMQALLDAVRATGAAQPVLAGGLAWASDLTGWPTHRPADPAHALAASFHAYNFGGCNSSACWDSQLAPLAATVPVVTGELGENDCAGGYINGFMAWADQHRLSYLGWTWDTWDCAGGPALITAYSGAATAFGAALRDHLATLQPRPIVALPAPRRPVSAIAPGLWTVAPGLWSGAGVRLLPLHH